MAKLIMGIGLPGAGKTTVLKDFAERHKYTYMSRDDVRREFNILRGQDSSEAVFNEIQKRVKESLGHGKTVVIDSTFVTGPHRREFMEFARACGAKKIQGVFFDTPTNIAWDRNRAREQHMPEEIFKNRAHDLQDDPPTFKDGFDGLYTLDEYQKLTEAETLDEKREFSWGKTDLR